MYAHIINYNLFKIKQRQTTTTSNDIFLRNLKNLAIDISASIVTGKINIIRKQKHFFTFTVFTYYIKKTILRVKKHQLQLL